MTLQALKQAARLQGYLVLDYSKSMTALLALGIYKPNRFGVVLRYDDEQIIFINDKLPEKQQMYVLAHELGHIALEHISQDRKYNEDEANAFASAVTGIMSFKEIT